jgi:hypothetical protein
MMSPMSDSRETTLNESPVDASPRTKRDSFHWPKYSLIVGTITTSAVKASDGVGCQACAFVERLAGVAVEGIRGGCEDARIRQRLAERDLPVLVEIGLDAGGELRPRAQSIPSVRL